MSHKPSETLPDALYYLGNQETAMLSSTKTIEAPLSPSELVSLDTQQVFEAYCTAIQSKDKKMACEYAKVFMLKAFACNRWFLRISKRQKNDFLRYLKNWEILESHFFVFLRFLKL